MDTPTSEYNGRFHFDYCVDWIANQLDEAAKVLPANRTVTNEWGRATSTIAKAVKARLLLYAASPLWNGSFPYPNWQNENFETPGYGKALVSNTYDKSKWERALAVGDIRLKIRDILGAFMFGGEASDKKVKVLSGGERTRLAMIKLLLEPVNFLILDEPTNHLDMRSKDVLKEAIRDFDGTVIIVSHDRDFLDGLATKVYEFGGGLVKEHLGGIYDFLQKKQIESLNELQKSPSLSASPTAGKAASGNVGAEPVQPSAAKLSYEEQKELNKKLKKLERRVADCEAEIEQTEAAIAILEARMATPEGASDMSLYEQHQKLKEQLDRVMEEWDAATVELENH
jgi:ATP-binding cassette subfamily F protein 3